LLDKVLEHYDFLVNTIQVGKECIEPFPLYQHMFLLGICHRQLDPDLFERNLVDTEWVLRRGWGKNDL
jgi:hypothetical protein